MTKDEIILAQQARIEQLKESALRILRNKRGNDDWLILTIDCVGLEETLSIPDDLSALRAHDEKLRAVFQAGAASRDAEVVSLTNQRDYEYVRAENAEQERDQFEQERDQLREQVALLREALLTCSVGDFSTGHVIYPSFDEKLVEEALAATEPK